MEDQVQSSACPIMQECIRKVRENATERARINREYEYNYSQLQFAKVYAWRFRDDYRDIMETVAGMYFEADPTERTILVQVMMAVTRVYWQRYRRHVADINYFQNLVKKYADQYADNMAEAAVIEVDCYNCK